MSEVPVAERLAQLALFADLHWPELEAVAHTFEEEVFGEGERAIRQGISGSAFYVVLDGEASVLVDGTERARLGRGDFFGEISALTGEVPTADVRAQTMLRCLVLPGPQLEALLPEHPAVTLRTTGSSVRSSSSTSETTIAVRHATRWRPGSAPLPSAPESRCGTGVVGSRPAATSGGSFSPRATGSIAAPWRSSRSG